MSFNLLFSKFIAHKFTHCSSPQYLIDSIILFDRSRVCRLINDPTWKVLSFWDVIIIIRISFEIQPLCRSKSGKHSLKIRSHLLKFSRLLATKFPYFIVAKLLCLNEICCPFSVIMSGNLTTISHSCEYSTTCTARFPLPRFLTTISGNESFQVEVMIGFFLKSRYWMYCELKYKGVRPLLLAMALLLISQYNKFGNEIFSVVVKPAFRRVKTSILVR